MKNTVIISEVIDDAMAQVHKASQIPINSWHMLFTHHATEDVRKKFRDAYLEAECKKMNRKENQL